MEEGTGKKVIMLPLNPKEKQKLPNWDALFGAVITKGRGMKFNFYMNIDF